MNDISKHARRLSPAVIASIVLWSAILAGSSAFVARHWFGASSVSQLRSAVVTFSHIYPPDPYPFERPPVGTASPNVPARGRIHTGTTVTSISALAAAVPTGYLVQEAPGVWRLQHPIELGAGTHVTLSDHLQLQIAPNAFILAQRGAVLRLRGISIVAIDETGRPAMSPDIHRGFLDARSGAVLTLVNDKFNNLGYLGDQTYGVTMDGASPRSSMIDCTVVHDFFGVYLGRMSGGLIQSSRFIDSVIYGIDPHTFDSHLRILNNTVTGAGVHGIVIAEHVSESLIAGNVVTTSRYHGIVVYQFSNSNTIRDNQIRGVFDGIVIVNSSHNIVSHNVIGPTTRFGLRVSGTSSGNVFRDNSFSHGLVGAYLYQGATGNNFIGNVFRHEYENVRFRSDAKGNLITPTPGRSEL